MLGTSEEKIIKGLLPEMARIQNAIPGEVFTSKDADALMVVQRRIEDCEVKRQLQQFNEIFGRQNGTSITDITNSMIAFVRIKVLLAEGVSDFDGRSYRELIKECRSQIDRTTNIIRLSKANAMTAEDFQKDKINLTIRKNETFISCFEAEIAAVEKKIERMPVPIDETKEAPEEEEVKEEIQPKKAGPSFAEKLNNFLHARADKREVEEHLRNEEKKSSSTMCEEIPYYEKKLAFTDYKPCKDMAAYCILKKKENVYFGLRAHVAKGIYYNLDQSLIELTNVSDEFVQLMTENVLSGEYKLGVLSEAEKKSMQMYFNFVTDCFEKHIGVTLTATEYMTFKDYYSRLVNTCLRLETNSRINYYRALPLADKYLAYMVAYNMVYSESKEEILGNIATGDSVIYQENLQLILDNHMVNDMAADGVRDLIASLKYFLEPEIEDVPEAGLVVTPQDFEKVKLKVVCLDIDGQVTDEAIYASSNLPLAVADYMSRNAFYKKVGLFVNGKEIYLLGARDGGLSVPIFTEKQKEIRGLDEGTGGQLLAFYEEQIKKEMLNITEYAEVKKNE